jgi:ATP-binding cassette subfamily F protein 3
VTLSFPKPHPKVDDELIPLENVVAGYGDKIVRRNVGFCVDASDSVALFGANGNGKSMLAKLLSNQLAPLSGNICHARHAKISYFSEQ